MTARVLTLPGWQGSGPAHWQTLWQERYGDRRVEQHDWLHPRRGDWMARLEDVLLGEPAPVWLAAHSLGCHLVTAWAAHSAHTARVRGALLVAPPDVERADMPAALHGWRPIVSHRLPFPATVVASSDDSYCSLERAASMAQNWGARWAPLGPYGHVNAESGLGAWPEGRALLEALECE
jgi:predicted alpha/beta hydrolase family esterase